MTYFNLTSAPVVTAPVQAPLAVILDESKRSNLSPLVKTPFLTFHFSALPEAYILSNDYLTHNCLKKLQVIILPATNVDALTTYFNLTARLQYSLTGVRFL